MSAQQFSPPQVQQKPRPRRPRPDRLLYFVALLLVIQVALFVVPHVRPGPLGWVCWVIGSDPSLWIVVAAGMLVIALVWALWKPPVLNRWRVMGVLALVALVASTAM